MTRKKVDKNLSDKSVLYDDKHWKILKQKRNYAIQILRQLNVLQTENKVYGSISRGDVTINSDIDIIVLDRIPSYIIENAIADQFTIITQHIVMATPNHAVKGILELENEITISFPLFEFKEREIEFYNFGGSLNLASLGQNIRVPGIDKRLVLIEPNDLGHRERALNYVPDKELRSLGFSQRIIEERLRVLQRRDKVGRTGVFINEFVDPDVGFERTLSLLTDRNHLLRRKYSDAT